MLDIRRLRANLEEVKELVMRRGHGDYGLDKVVSFDEKRRTILQEVEQMKNKQNTVSKEIGRASCRERV